MTTLIYKGTRNMKAGTDPATVSICVLGVGKVTGNVPFEVSDERAAELLSKPRLVFETVYQPKKKAAKE